MFSLKKRKLEKERNKQEKLLQEQKEVVNKVTFDDVIGLDNVKELINQMVVYPFKYKEIYKVFKRSSGGGILLYGAPGTGKTMIAKAIANESNSSKKIIERLYILASQNKSLIFFSDSPYHLDTISEH